MEAKTNDWQAISDCKFHSRLEICLVLMCPRL